jgi:hypothetical protein
MIIRMVDHEDDDSDRTMMPMASTPMLLFHLKLELILFAVVVVVVAAFVFVIAALGRFGAMEEEEKDDEDDKFAVVGVVFVPSFRVVVNSVGAIGFCCCCRCCCSGDSYSFLLDRWLIRHYPSHPVVFSLDSHHGWITIMWMLSYYYLDWKSL